MKNRNNLLAGFAFFAVFLMLVTSVISMPAQEKVVSDSLLSEPVEDSGCSLCAKDIPIGVSSIAAALGPTGWPYSTCYALFMFLKYYWLAFNLRYLGNKEMPDFWQDLYEDFMTNCDWFFPDPGGSL